jgi:hypothetical protein
MRFFGNLAPGDRFGVIEQIQEPEGKKDEDPAEMEEG